MKLPRTTRTCRPGFSLVELLVAMAIIAILVAIVVVAVLPMLWKGPEMNTRDDLSKFNQSMEQFKTTFKVEAPPSPFKLCASSSFYGSSAQDQTCLQYLNRMFPNMAQPWTVDWSNGTTSGFVTNKSGVTLDGDQVLVFFLGGLPSTTGQNGCLGFSSNQKAPGTAPSTQSEVRKGPYFPFVSNRLITRGSGHNFFSYADWYSTNMPYVYFSPGRTKNNYNSAPFSASSPYTVTFGSGSVTAYFQTVNSLPQYFNPDSFQVISAGKDGAFGQGGSWSPGTANSSTAIQNSANSNLQTGADDMSNFYGAKLGVPNG